MTDLTITAANVIPGSDASFITGVAGATITAGQAVYRDATTGRFLLADADAEASAKLEGIAVNGASTGQNITIQIGGEITIGGTVVVGQVYVASATAGGIAPYADLLSGDFVSIVGVGISATKIALRRNVSNIAKA
ncbi:MAG: hypothetical protein MUF38_18745 [Anaerolineae bacterium]|jgi:hypothetical protein|nr:hypothetical protein [Anaerolineae bacterium]